VLSLIAKAKEKKRNIRLQKEKKKNNQEEKKKYNLCFSLKKCA
jgi:hypothetical protein